MFLLLLMGLGAAGVKAQVRIGGNTAPSAAVVLDLNATDATTNGTKGLALPRVNLTDTLMQLTTGTANLSGTVVYNTSAALGAGIYFWSGTRWRQASLPYANGADSGRLMYYNGGQWGRYLYLSETSEMLTLSSPFVDFLNIPFPGSQRGICVWDVPTMGSGGGWFENGTVSLFNTGHPVIPAGNTLWYHCTGTMW